MVKYWLRILKMNTDRYLNHAYHEQCNLAERGVECWAKALKSILFHYGFAEAWYNQGVGNEILFLSEFKQRCKDIEFQQWHVEICSYSRLNTYKLFKHTLTVEPYLVSTMKPIFKSMITSFRLSNHPLNIEQGRRKNIVKENRLCICNDGCIENEYHFLLQCELYKTLRDKYIPEQYSTNPNLNKFTNLMSTSNPDLLRNIGKYLFYAFKTRDDHLNSAV